MVALELRKEFVAPEVLLVVGFEDGDELGVHVGHFLLEVCHGLALCFFVEVVDEDYGFGGVLGNDGKNGRANDGLGEGSDLWMGQ